MITAGDLLHNEQYKFEHLTINILKKDDTGKVDAYSASYRRGPIDEGLTPAIMEANQLWDAGSGKRPPGYLVFAAFEGRGGVSRSILISKRFYERCSRSQLNRLRREWERHLNS